MTHFTLHYRDCDWYGLHNNFPNFIYAVVKVGSLLRLWDYAEVTMKITTKAVVNPLREPHITSVVGVGLKFIHPLAVEGVRGGVSLWCAACLYHFGDVTDMVSISWGHVIDGCFHFGNNHFFI